MAEEQATPPVVTQGNATEARTETGEIKDQQTTQPAGTANQETAKTETKPATEGEKKPEAGKDGEKKPEAAKPEPGKVPEKYDLTAPEGFTIDPKLVEEVTPMFKELGLDNAGAQKLTDFWNKQQADATEKANSAYETTRTTWRNDIIKSDLGDGKEGLKPEVKANISKAIEAIGDVKQQQAFKEAMDITGAGDNPAIAHALNAFGKLLAEGTAVRGGGPAKTGQSAPGASERPSPAAAMYPNLASSSKP